MTRTALSLIVIVAASLSLAQHADAGSFKDAKHQGDFGNHCWRPPCPPPICPPHWKPCPPNWKPCPPHWNPCPPQFGVCPPQWGVYPTPYPQPVSPVFGQNPPYSGGWSGYQNASFTGGATQRDASRPDPSSLFNR